MEHEHTQHVAAPPDRVFAALADIENLPRYVPQVTAARRTEGDTVSVEARYEGHTQRGEAWFRAEEQARRIEWGSPDSDYHGGSKSARTARALASRCSLRRRAATPPTAR